MTYNTQAGTIEDILARMLRDLPPAIIQEFTGKSPNHFYKVKNPNNNLGVHFIDALALDRAAKVYLGETPFFKLFQAIAEEQAGRAANPSSRPADTLTLGQMYGQLCQAQLEHDLDGALDPHEVDKEIRTLEHIERQAAQMKSNLVLLRGGHHPSIRGVG